MYELKKNRYNIEFLCTMDMEEPHLWHIHLQTVSDTHINLGLYYFNGKQEGIVGAQRLAQKFNSWIWTNIPSMKMTGCLNSDCSTHTTCAKH